VALGVRSEEIKPVTDEEREREVSALSQRLTDVLNESTARNDVRLYALLDTVGAVLQCSADVKAACEETRADLAEVIRAVLTPECEFETRRRRTSLKVVRPEEYEE